MRNLTITLDQQKHIQINYKLKKQKDLAEELNITLGVLKANARLMNLCTDRPKRNKDWNEHYVQLSLYVKRKYYKRAEAEFNQRVKKYR
jgi:hypothetical protein